MFRKINCKILTLLLILAFSLQLISHSFFENEEFIFGEQKHKMHFTTSVIKLGTTMFRLQARKLFNKSSLSSFAQYSCEVKSVYANIYKHTKYKEVKFDFRKRIETTECNQLHGSSYI